MTSGLQLTVWAGAAVASAAYAAAGWWAVAGMIFRDRARLRQAAALATAAAVITVFTAVLDSRPGAAVLAGLGVVSAGSACWRYRHR